MVGAILTQNTAWKNVEKAIVKLKAANCLDARSMHALEIEDLAELIRSSGYYNVKAQRLKNYINWYSEAGEYRYLAGLETNILRQQLLSVKGIGPETADDILLYAFKRPVFVIDVYTRRLLLSTGLIEVEENYEVLRQAIETALEPNAQLFNEYHALIVRHGKEPCSTLNKKDRNDCRHCQVEKPLG